jgi:hypothetical protein
MTRITGSSRPGISAYSAAGRRTEPTSSFSVGTPAASAAPAETASVAGLTSLEALMALQGVGDALEARRKSVKRGRQLLDTLDELKADLLLGRISEGRLNQLLALVGQARERSEPGLDAVMDDIELRAQVELAKFEHRAAA